MPVLPCLVCYINPHQDPWRPKAIMLDSEVTRKGGVSKESFHDQKKKSFFIIKLRSLGKYYTCFQTTVPEATHYILHKTSHPEGATIILSLKAKRDQEEGNLLEEVCSRR